MSTFKRIAHLGAHLFTGMGAATAAAIALGAYAYTCDWTPSHLTHLKRVVSATEPTTIKFSKRLKDSEQLAYCLKHYTITRVHVRVPFSLAIPEKDHDSHDSRDSHVYLTASAEYSIPLVYDHPQAGFSEPSQLPCDEGVSAADTLVDEHARYVRNSRAVTEQLRIVPTTPDAPPPPSAVKRFPPLKGILAVMYINPNWGGIDVLKSPAAADMLGVAPSTHDAPQLSASLQIPDRWLTRYVAKVLDFRRMYPTPHSMPTVGSVQATSFRRRSKEEMAPYRKRREGDTYSPLYCPYIDAPRSFERAIVGTVKVSDAEQLNVWHQIVDSLNDEDEFISSNHDTAFYVIASDSRAEDLQSHLQKRAHEHGIQVEMFQSRVIREGLTFEQWNALTRVAKVDVVKRRPHTK
jgi:hypothetical protein